jgi:hypothetical protein
VEIVEKGAELLGTPVKIKHNRKHSKMPPLRRRTFGFTVISPPSNGSLMGIPDTFAKQKPLIKYLYYIIIQYPIIINKVFISLIKTGVNPWILKSWTHTGTVRMKKDEKDEIFTKIKLYSV